MPQSGNCLCHFVYSVVVISLIYLPISYPKLTPSPTQWAHGVLPRQVEEWYSLQIITMYTLYMYISKDRDSKVSTINHFWLFPPLPLAKQVENIWKNKRVRPSSSPLAWASDIAKSYKFYEYNSALGPTWAPPKSGMLYYSTGALWQSFLLRRYETGNNKHLLSPTVQTVETADPFY
jgi:hypothetical protein